MSIVSTVIIPNLLPDVVREEKEREILCKADWSKNFAKLGLKKEFLQVALDRKKRSTLKADARAKEREIERQFPSMAACHHPKSSLLSFLFVESVGSSSHATQSGQVAGRNLHEGTF